MFYEASTYKKLKCTYSIYTIYSLTLSHLHLHLHLHLPTITYSLSFTHYHLSTITYPLSLIQYKKFSTFHQIEEKNLLTRLAHKKNYNLLNFYQFIKNSMKLLPIKTSYSMKLLLIKPQ